MSGSVPLLPLMVGVTGHRDLLEEEVPLLERAVQQFFLELRARFPDLPILVTTPLAEGADRLVATVARRLDMPLNFLLPMPVDHYEFDFEGISAEVFAEMLQWGETIELPLLQHLPDGNAMPDGTARDAQYEYLGIYLAAHSHILLAIWDGRPSSAPGGTAQVVQFHQENAARLISGVATRSAVDFSEDESDLTYHIGCSRRSVPGTPPALAPGVGEWLTRDDVHPRTRELPLRYEHVFGRQEQLNRDLMDAAVRGAPAIGRDSQSGITTAADIGRLAETVDGLALRFQRRALISLRAIYALVALAGISFIGYADFPHQDGMIWVYLTFLALGMLLYALERRGAWYRRYLDYRALAEGLRVQNHWAAAGVRPSDPTQFTHDRFMRREELSLGWIRNVMRYAGRASDASAGSPSANSLEIVLTAWIKDQHAYYRRRLGELQRRDRLTGRLSVAGFALGLLAAILLALFQAVLDDAWTNLLIATMAGLPFLAAVRSSFAERICERQLIDQYARMNRIYDNAARLLQTETDRDRQRDILRALGEEALQEVGQWLLRQRERPVSGDQLFRIG